MGTVMAICRSDARGTQKQETASAFFRTDWGMEGDAHAGNWHRQVSLLSHEKVEAFRAKGAEVKPGAFGENLVVSGMDFRSLPVGTRFRCGDVLMELTQIGKECHSHCAIYHQMGDCIMPREGVFAKVLSDGLISVGDSFEIVRGYCAAVLTLSDKGSQGLREDKSGPIIAEALEKSGYTVDIQSILPDEQAQIEEVLCRLSDKAGVDLIFTTGGTGFSRRDVTPEATMAVSDRNAPGIAEAIRMFSMKITPRAMLSRGVSVIRGNTLIINLPGSPKAVQEILGDLLPQLQHGIDILKGDAQECARK